MALPRDCLPRRLERVFQSTRNIAGPGHVVRSWKAVGKEGFVNRRPGVREEKLILVPQLDKERVERRIGGASGASKLRRTAGAVRSPVVVNPSATRGPRAAPELGFDALSKIVVTVGCAGSAAASKETVVFDGVAGSAGAAGGATMSTVGCSTTAATANPSTFRSGLLVPFGGTVGSL